MPASASSVSGRRCWFTACVVLIQVEMWLVANEDVKGVCDSVDIHKGERILMEMSRKFTLKDIRQLAFQSNFYVQVAAPPFSGHPLGPPHAVKQLSCSHKASFFGCDVSDLCIVPVENPQPHACSKASTLDRTALPSSFLCDLLFIACGTLESKS